MRMKLAALILLLAVPSQARLYISCAIHPLQHSKAILGKQAGASDRLWTCGVTNSGTVERVVTEADVIVVMQGLGVRAVQASAVRIVMERKLKTGRLRTTARVLGHLSDFAVIGVALDVIKMSPAWRSFVGLAGTALPVIGPALAGRTPDGTGLEILHVTEPLGIKPGAGVKLAMWSGPHDGPLIVRGYMADYTAPGFSAVISVALVLGPPIPAWRSQTPTIITIPLPRCPHILPSDCAGRCEGWWMSRDG